MSVDNRTQEAEAVLRRIAEHWGKPMPHGVTQAYIAREWRLQCNYVQNLARQYLNMPIVGDETVEQYEARD